MSHTLLPIIVLSGLLILGIGMIGTAFLIGFGNETSMAGTFSSYVEAINEGYYGKAIELVDGDCLDDLANIAPPEGAIEWELLMAAEGEDAGMIAFHNNLTEGTGWQLMTKVDGDWKVACEVPW